ncbi:MAG: cytochrome c [Acidimicrobiales bacterium]|nr:cytochrome c [Acidimicrobiales bacterium]
MTRTSGALAHASRVIIVATLICLGLAAAAFATDETPPEAPVGDAALERAIADGRLVYEANCVGCHRADGTGISGTFPPLVDNPNIEDAEYVRGVVKNGLSGPIEVLGESYDGAMPAFSLLNAEQIDAVVAYVQKGLGKALPAAPEAAVETGPIAATELPGASTFVAMLAFLVFAAAAVAVLWTPVIAAGNVQDFSTPQVWLKSAVIVGYFIVVTVMLPSQVMEAEWLARPPSVYGDLFSPEFWDVIRSLIGSGVWLATIGLGVWGLRWVQRREVI